MSLPNIHHLTTFAAPAALCLLMTLACTPQGEEADEESAATSEAANAEAANSDGSEATDEAEAPQTQAAGEQGEAAGTLSESAAGDGLLNSEEGRERLLQRYGSQPQGAGGMQLQLQAPGTYQQQQPSLLNR